MNITVNKIDIYRVRYRFSRDGVTIISSSWRHEQSIVTWSAELSRAIDARGRCVKIVRRVITRGELGHSVVACARTTGHDCARTNPVQPSPAEWLLSKKGSNLRSSDLFMAWNYPWCYFKPVCGYQPVNRPFRIVEAELSVSRSWSRLCPYYRGSGHSCARLRSRLCPYYKHTKSRHCEGYICTYHT